MSQQRVIFDAEVRMSNLEEFSPQRWTNAIDNLSGMSIWEILRSLDALTPAKRDEVLSAAQTVLVKGRGWTGPFSRIEWAMKIVNDQRYTPPPPGLFVAREGITDPAEVMDAKVFIAERTKGQGGQPGDFISLDQPSIAYNAAGLNIRYKMNTTKSIPRATSVDTLIAEAAKQNLKHLIFNAHGEVAKGGGTIVAVGSGLDSSNTKLFTQLSGKVGVIWICGCLAANSESGKNDCIERARNAKAFLIAPAFLMSAGGGDLAAGRMDMNQRFQPHVFTPTGGSVAFMEFLKQQSKALGFTTHFSK